MKQKDFVSLQKVTYTAFLQAKKDNPVNQWKNDGKHYTIIPCTVIPKAGVCCLAILTDDLRFPGCHTHHEAQ